MKKSLIIVSGILICAIAINLFQYIQIRQLKNQNTTLMNEYNNIKPNSNGQNQIDNSENKASEDENNNNSRNITFREGFKIELYENYDGFPSIPAYGALAELNPFAANNSNAVKIIRKENDLFTRISVEGVVPTWLIENGDNIKYIGNKIMYALQECDAYLSPDESLESVFSLYRGNALTVSAEYKDWYFITKNYKADPNTFDYGWVKKTNLGYYNEFDSNIDLEVNIKPGSPIKYYGDDTVEIVKDSSTWGRILEESENEYTLGLPGASVVTVEKKYVEPFSENN